ncbi:efflux RND transporter periplasmic adaptor subunit [Hyphomicrobium sp. LHD-15]|uniref:efflux RND transporter periplasmic adaptor subunit n=1 Tax=Hyphomicrobium sp. LHD-15 TaxID=3072142 RepID=UPI00280DEEBC|nr:efflux RND transporter periplasmic adaptor subunit [Hyphomicrobium sp. LHD-15]MDQ8698115.1 efflux RND transporter periplasmic adaptor subunit [Hyphomicrobium sp. LHD-15]
MTSKALVVSGLALAAFAGLGGWLATQPDGAATLSGGLKTLGLGPEAAIAEAVPAAKDKKPPLRSVRVVRPEAAAGTSTLTLAGRTAPKEQALVSSRASGVVAERKVDIGDHVKEGDVLVVIEAPEIEQELLRARASVDQMKARLELARATLDRAESLVGKGHVSEQTVDERRATKMGADADLAAALAEVKRLEEVKSFQTIRAPFEGIVVARQVERGDKVSADSSQQGGYLLRIADLADLRIEIDVPQSYSLQVVPGVEAKVSFAEIPDQALKARVARSSGLVDQTSSTMRAELLMPNPGNRIPAGLSGQVTLEVGTADGTVTIPTNTLITREGRQMVATVDEQDRVRLKPVTVARDLGERVVIPTGLTVNDRVIVSPNALLRAGDQVEILTPTAKAGDGKK